MTKVNRREFFKLLTATPAVFLVAKYGLPNGGELPAPIIDSHAAMAFHYSTNTYVQETHHIVRVRRPGTPAFQSPARKT